MFKNIIEQRLQDTSGDTRYHSCLRNHTTSQKVANSIPVKVTKFFRFTEFWKTHYGSGCYSASNGNEYPKSSWPSSAEGEADKLTAICEPVIQKMWETGSLATLWDSRVSYKDSFTFFTRCMQIRFIRKNFLYRCFKKTKLLA
jgi:hypothetical protein